MTGLAALTLLLYLFSVARVTRLINADQITDPIRIKAANSRGVESNTYYFLTCAWCVSMWIGLATAWIPLVLTDLPLWLWPFLGLSVSQITGLAASLDGDDDSDIEYV